MFVQGRAREIAGRDREKWGLKSPTCPKNTHFFRQVLNDEGDHDVNEHVHQLRREVVLALKLHGQPESKSHFVAAQPREQVVGRR